MASQAASSPNRDGLLVEESGFVAALFMAPPKQSFVEENLADLSNLDHSFQPHIARFHSAFHSAREHTCPRLSIGERHSNCHQRSGAVLVKSGFNMVVGRRIWQVHSLDMNDPAIRLEFQKLAGDMEFAASAIRPFVTELAARFRVIDAYGH